MGNLEILDVRLSVCEIGEEHNDVIEIHKEHEEHSEGEISMKEYMKFANMLQLQLLSPTVLEESKGNSTTSYLGEAESTCK
jgi:hypothetical protein